MQSGPNQPQGGFDPFFQQQPQMQWQQNGMPPQPTMPNGQWPQQGQPMGAWPQQPMMPGQQPPVPNMQWQQPMAGQPGFQQWPQQPDVMQQSQYDAYMQQAPQMPTMQQPVEQPVQRGKKRRPRRQNPGGGWWKIALLLVLVLGAAWFFLKDVIGQPKLNTAVVQDAQLGETHVGDALIVRNEVAYDDEGVQNIVYVAQEGSLVYRGDVVCYVYSTGYSSKEMTTLQDYRDQIKNYQQTLLKSETAYDQKMNYLESEVLEYGLGVRNLVHGMRGNLLKQEEDLASAITQRQNYFRSKYSSDMRLNRLYDDEATQKQRIESWIKQKVAVQESIVSFYTDGFEYALTPTEYEKYSPSEVRSMINGQKPAASTAQRGRTDLYRLIKQNNYAVLMLVKDSMWNPVEGAELKLVLEQFNDTVVDARVISFTRSGGELLLRLAVIGDVKDVLYMRTCSARLGEYVDCLRVPKKALYQKGDQDGVILVDGDNQFFVPVKVLSEEKGDILISPVQVGTLVKDQTVRLF